MSNGITILFIKQVSLLNPFIVAREHIFARLKHWSNDIKVSSRSTSLLCNWHSLALYYSLVFHTSSKIPNPIFLPFPNWLPLNISKINPTACWRPNHYTHRIKPMPTTSFSATFLENHADESKKWASTSSH